MKSTINLHQREALLVAEKQSPVGQPLPLNDLEPDGMRLSTGFDVGQVDGLPAGDHLGRINALAANGHIDIGIVGQIKGEDFGQYVNAGVAHKRAEILVGIGNSQGDASISRL